MRAAWYERQGPAQEVLTVGAMPDPTPGPGEVRVRVRYSAVHVGDVGKRLGHWGSTMSFPRVVPHGDGSGVVDQVGDGVPADRLGETVWVFLAQSYRPFGTAAELVVVPAEHAVRIPDGKSQVDFAGLGIPGITGHRAVHSLGPVAGEPVVVTGVFGAVGRAALVSARRAGAQVVGIVRHRSQVSSAIGLGAGHAVVAGPGVVEEVDEITGGRGAHRIVEIDFAANVERDLEILRVGGGIATYASAAVTDLPFWPLAFKNVVVHYLSNDDFPEDANQVAAADLTAAVADGELRYPIAEILGLDRIAESHDLAQAAPSGSRVLIDLEL